MAATHNPVIIVNDGRKLIRLSNAKKWRIAIDARIIGWETSIEYEAEADKRLPMLAGDCPVLTDLLIEILGSRPVLPKPDAKKASPSDDSGNDQENRGQTDKSDAPDEYAADQKGNGTETGELSQRLTAIEKEVNAESVSAQKDMRNITGKPVKKSTRRPVKRSSEAREKAKRKMFKDSDNPWHNPRYNKDMPVAAMRRAGALRDFSQDSRVKETGQSGSSPPLEESNVFSFAGRIGRSTFFAHSAGVIFIWLILLGWLGEDSAWLGLSAIGLMWVTLAANVKRCRDVAMTPWWLLIYMIPFVGTIFWLVLLLSPTAKPK